MYDVCHRGDIYYIMPCETVGCEQAGGRPGIIVSNELNNMYSRTVEVVLLTTRAKKPLPTHVPINSARHPSTALCEQITTVAKERIGSYVGRVTPAEQQEVDAALLRSIALYDTGDGNPKPTVASAEGTDQEGICPVCGHAVTYTGDGTSDDDGGTHFWECKRCGSSGKEGYTRTFERHYDVENAAGRPIPGRPE